MYAKHETTSEWLRELDPNDTGFVQLEPFKQLLRSICPELVEQEIITVCRRYDLDGDGQVSMIRLDYFILLFKLLLNLLLMVSRFLNL